MAKRLSLVLAIATLAALLVALVIASLQAQMLFPAHAVGPAQPVPAAAEQLRLRTDGGNELRGVHIPPAGKDSGLLVLGFGGNAWNGSDVALYLHSLYPEAHVVAFHYRGYRPSTGSPSAEALLADAPLVYDHAAERVRPDAIVAVGFSIGSGIAASLATRRQLAGIVLVTPFDSLKAVAASLFPWLPVGAFFAHEIDAATALRDASVPVAIIAAERDEIIPASRTEALRRKIEPAFDRTIAGAGHNDIYQRREFEVAMRMALAQVIAKAAE